MVAEPPWQPQDSVCLKALKPHDGIQASPQTGAVQLIFTKQTVTGPKAKGGGNEGEGGIRT